MKEIPLLDLVNTALGAAALAVSCYQLYLSKCRLPRHRK